MRVKTLWIAPVIAATCAGVAFAAAGKTLRATSTFKLAAGKTKRFAVAYPDALEYGGATYGGTVTILAPAASERGSRPVLGKVDVESRGSALGDSQYATKVRNANAAGTSPVRVQLTATTTLPPGAG